MCDVRFIQQRFIQQENWMKEHIIHCFIKMRAREFGTERIRTVHVVGVHECMRIDQAPTLQSAGVDSFSLDVGYKIATGFSAVVSLLPPPHYHCWSLFVEAMCNRTVSLDLVNDRLVAQHHMHCHLKDSILDPSGCLALSASMVYL